MRAILDRTVFAGLLLLLMALPGEAAEWRIELDPASTEISFEVGATLHTVHGSARLSAGWLVLDPGTGSASGRIVVDARSLNTAHEGRDAKMHAKVLESEAYPEMVFSPKSMSGVLSTEGESRVVLEGSFTIHGEEHPLTVDVQVKLENETLQARVEFDVPYVAWGMRDPSRLVLRVAKQVRVRIESRGQARVDEGAGGPAH